MSLAHNRTLKRVPPTAPDVRHLVSEYPHPGNAVKRLRARHELAARTVQTQEGLPAEQDNSNFQDELQILATIYGERFDTFAEMEQADPETQQLVVTAIERRNAMEAIYHDTERSRRQDQARADIEAIVGENAAKEAPAPDTEAAPQAPLEPLEPLAAEHSRQPESVITVDTREQARPTLREQAMQNLKENLTGDRDTRFSLTHDINVAQTQIAGIRAALKTPRKKFAERRVDKWAEKVARNADANGNFIPHHRSKIMNKLHERVHKRRQDKLAEAVSSKNSIDADINKLRSDTAQANAERTSRREQRYENRDTRKHNRTLDSLWKNDYAKQAEDLVLHQTSEQIRDSAEYRAEQQKADSLTNRTARKRARKALERQTQARIDQTVQARMAREFGTLEQRRAYAEQQSGRSR